MDHPRACGEQMATRPMRLSSVGSSPRVRGTARYGRNARSGPWIIPARAGNSYHTENRQAEYEDHPRACGEQLGDSAKASGDTGSSPRVRGTVARGDVRHRPPGIIPARAGNNRQSPGWPVPPWDHPRACGEQLEPSSMTRMRTGSSPRVRGTGPVFEAAPRLDGIIPARAGNSNMES